MKPNTIIIVLIVGVAFVGLFALGYYQKGATRENLQSADSANNSKSLLTASETPYDFGSISMKNGNVNKIFKITNPTDKDITVKKIATSCMCTNAYIVKGNSEIGPFGMEGMGHSPTANEIIKAGESIDLKVVYDPNAHGPAGVGQIDRFVTLADVQGGTLELQIKAMVTP
ncbi:MAG: DUF1573 domain-containing protein [bacterium]|nr:DUF1573 domain-containing protein [bacterium]